MRNVAKSFWVSLLLFSIQSFAQRALDLSGRWSFQIDSADQGENEKWYVGKLKDSIQLPGSMASNNKGFDITTNTPWTGSIFDSSWFVKDEYAKYRTEGNIKVPFWLQPVKYYKGAAWYGKSVIIPESWKGNFIELFLERVHWQTKVWVDGVLIGEQNSLATPHIYNISKPLTPGHHTITIKVDNRILDVNVGQNSHSITDHTQTNWNGIVGSLLLIKKPFLKIEDVRLYPDISKKQVHVHAKINNLTGHEVKANIVLQAIAGSILTSKPIIIKREIRMKGVEDSVEIIYPMGDNTLLWDEFHPNLYKMQLHLTIDGAIADEKLELFGMRAFSTQGHQFTINGRPVFLRGTLECAVFPKTGYPPTDTASWMRIFRIARSYGLNHFRFHSWCPPEAAFTAADMLGFYLQIEICSWANWGSSVGDGKPIDKYLYQESERIVNAYGNHPSFCMMAYGNEPAGQNLQSFLTQFENYWKRKDLRRLYTTAAGWPIVPDNDYNSSPDPRIQHWGEGLKSIINREKPSTDYDWRNIVSAWEHPTVSHEIGQWCAYPDLKEIKEYTGVLRAKNFEIFKEKLESNHLGGLADSFLLASGKLQGLCYKADIEAALRTPGFGGFQLLSLYDFPGQGSALVGVLNAFWENKGYCTPDQYSRFCNYLVPLARFSKMVYTNDEELVAPVEVANYGESELKESGATWSIKNKNGTELFSGKLPSKNIALGNMIKLGNIRVALSSIEQPEELTVIINVAGHENTWNIFVYPAKSVTDSEVYVTQSIDEKALGILHGGGKVLLSIKRGSLKAEKGGEIKIGFSSIFWNTAWTNGQPPVTLGILCDPQHPAFKYFPTEYYSNYQWWDAMSHSNAILLDSVAKGVRPIVRVIDDWVTARSLGLVFECRIGVGKLMVSGIDLITDAEKRPEARQLLFSLKKYISSNFFQPSEEVDINRIRTLIN